MEQFFQQNAWVILLLMIWIIPWKGYALWLSAKKNHKVWFIVLLLLNTIAILDIIYIFAIGRKNRKKEVDDESGSIKT